MKVNKSENYGQSGVNLVEGFFLSLGFLFREQIVSDYGIDAHAELINNEHATGQLLAIQIKAGESYFKESAENGITFRPDKKHVDYWLNHSLPVIICLCDLNNKIVYWQTVTEKTASPTKKGYKIIVPKSQTLNKSSLPKLQDILTPIIAKNRYTITRTKDLSHSLAKRYSLKILVNGRASKSEIAAIVRQVTDDAAKSRYHRNHMVKEAWGDADAHVVWTLVYPSVEDEANTNHICRSIWIHDSLPKSARPTVFQGENIGNNIILDWNQSYSDIKDFTTCHPLNKEQYLDFVEPCLTEMKKLRSAMADLFQKRLENHINESEFISDSKKHRDHIEKLMNKMNTLNSPPFECSEVDKPLQCFLFCLSNVALCYSDKEVKMRDEHTRHSLIAKQLEYAKIQEEHLKYELQKIK